MMEGGDPLPPPSFFFFSDSCITWKKTGGILFWLANICVSLIVKILSICFTLFPCSIWKQKEKGKGGLSLSFDGEEGRETLHSEKEVTFSCKYASCLSTTILSWQYKVCWFWAASLWSHDFNYGTFIIFRSSYLFICSTVFIKKIFLSKTDFTFQERSFSVAQGFCK